MLGVAPELPEDLEGWAAAFAYLAWGLSGNWDDELLRLRLSDRFGAETAAALLPPPAVDPPGLAAGSLAGRLLDGLPRSRGQGSNSWVVSGSRTASGRPLLANDPHLLVQQPAAWFELHLRAPGYEARGVALPFVPGILAGTTPHHAWGLTNVSGDVQDLYVERLNAEGTAAEFEGAWEPLTVHAETIEVRGGAAVALDVRETRHGPILETAPVGVAGNEYARVDGTFALRWAAADGLLEPVVLASSCARRRSSSSARRCAACGVRARTSCTPTSTARSASSARGGSRCAAPGMALPPSRAGRPITSGRATSPSRSSRGRRTRARGSSSRPTTASTTMSTRT
jgi:penicillin amidase